MKRLAFLILAVAVLLPVLAPRSAAAQTPTVVAFTAVDAVRLDGINTIRITGIKEGTAAPAEYAFSWSTLGDSGSQALVCEKMGLMALARPGQYRLEILVFSASAIGCKLARATP